MINLFQELAGKKGEVMAVAALRYLLMRNRPLREQFFKTLRTSVSYTLYQDVSYFGCEVEVSCRLEQDTDNSPGRLDMLVESNTAVVGIEAKLGHHISEEQIKKYLPELARRQALYRELHGQPVELHMVVLVPDWQRADAKSAIAQLKNVTDVDSLRVLTWDEVLDSLKNATDDAAMNTEDQFVLKTLESYIHYWTGKIEHFDFLWKAAYNEYRENNLMPHEQIIRHLSQFFQIGNSHLSGTTNYIGYSFSPDFTDDNTDSWDHVCWGWFGFIHKKLSSRL